MSTIEYTYDAKIAAIHKARVNVRSLAAEAKIIRQEERRCGPCYRDLLSLHRKDALRTEARYAQLALAFLRGRPYKTVEREGSKSVWPKRLQEKIKKWWPQMPDNAVALWLS